MLRVWQSISKCINAVHISKRWRTLSFKGRIMLLHVRDARHVLRRDSRWSALHAHVMAIDGMFIERKTAGRAAVSR